MSELVKSNIYRVLEQCPNCPFNDNGKAIHLEEGGVDKIKEMLLEGGSFNCHKTVYDLDTNMGLTESQSPKMCAGAYAFLKREGKPNQIMQVAERLGVEKCKR